MNILNGNHKQFDKIEDLVIHYFYSKQNMQTLVSYKDLVIDKEYIIYRSDDNIFWKGIFHGKYQRYYEEYPNLIFVHCVHVILDINSETCHTMNLDNWKNRVDFCKKDIFYDLEKIQKNSKSARDCMEQRSLDIVLKRLMNEEFKWS